MLQFHTVSEKYLCPLCNSHVVCWVATPSFPLSRCLQSNHFIGVRWRSSKPPLAMFPSRDCSLSRLCTRLKFLWDSEQPLPTLTAHVVISSSLMCGVSPTDQSWKPTGLSGHHQRGGFGRYIRHHWGLHPVEVRHPHPEDRQQLQGLHVRFLTPSIP